MSVEDKTPGRKGEGRRGVEGGGICRFAHLRTAEESNGQGPVKGSKNIGLQADAGLGDPGSPWLAPGLHGAGDSV